jgi:hypothetical protein
MDLYVTAGIWSGPDFRILKWHGSMRRAKISDLDPLFHDKPAPEAEVSVEFSMQRSLRRGSNTQARNKRIPADVVTLNNRWRAQERAGGRRPQFQMMEHNTDVRAALPALIRYSKSL